MLFCPQCRSLYNTRRAHCGLDQAPLSEIDEDPLVGVTFDERYLIVAPISRGAMGAVYRAKHAVLEHDYAMKILWGELASVPHIVERFKREARAISRLRHENILSVTDFGRTQAGLVYLAMELVEGRTLERAILDEAPFAPSRAARITRQIAAALGEAHRIGFVHRDVKPANVMLTSAHDDLKLLDFGLVAIVEAGDERLTKTGSVLGTPKYISPEQCLDPQVTASADLYSLGVILYEMLVGAPPFTGATVVELLASHLESEPPRAPPSEGLEVLVASLLMKKPSQRPANAGVVISEIDRLFGGGAPKRAALEPRPPALVARRDTDKELHAVHIHFEEPIEAANETPLEAAEQDTWDPDGAIASATPEVPPMFEEPPVPTPTRMRQQKVSMPVAPTSEDELATDDLLAEPEIPIEVRTRRKPRDV